MERVRKNGDSRETTRRNWRARDNRVTALRNFPANRALERQRNEINAAYLSRRAFAFHLTRAINGEMIVGGAVKLGENARAHCS